MRYKDVVWLIGNPEQRLSLAESLKALVGARGLAVFRSCKEALARSPKATPPRLVLIEGTPPASEITRIKSRMPGVRLFAVAACTETQAVKSRVAYTFLRPPLARPNVLKDQYALTARERDILVLMVQGFTTKEIANLLSLSFHTVNNRERRIYKKLNVHTKTAAVAKALTTGFLSD